MKHYIKKTVFSGGFLHKAPSPPPPKRPYMKPPYVGKWSMASSYTVAETLECLCEGPIEGFVGEDGQPANLANAVYLNNTPISTASSTELTGPNYTSWNNGIHEEKYRLVAGYRDFPNAKRTYFERSFSGDNPTFREKTEMIQNTEVGRTKTYETTGYFSPIDEDVLRRGSNIEWEWKFYYQKNNKKTFNWRPSLNIDVIIPNNLTQTLHAKIIVMHDDKEEEVEEITKNYSSAGTYNQKIFLPNRILEKKESQQKLTIKAYAYLEIEPTWDTVNKQIDWNATRGSSYVGRTEISINSPINEYDLDYYFTERRGESTGSVTNFFNVFTQYKLGQYDLDPMENFRFMSETFEYDFVLRGPFNLGGGVQRITSV